MPTKTLKPRKKPETNGKAKTNGHSTNGNGCAANEPSPRELDQRRAIKRISTSARNLVTNNKPPYPNSLAFEKDSGVEFYRAEIDRAIEALTELRGLVKRS
jgi:hypothetical protein